MKATRPRSQGANFGSADGLPDRQAGRTPLPPGRRRAGGAPLLVTALIAAVFGVVFAFLSQDSADADSGAPGMAIQVFSNTAKTDLICGINDTKCEVSTGTTFSVDIVTNPPPTGGFSAYRIVLRYTGGVNLVQQVGFTENRAPPCDVILSTEQKPPDYVHPHLQDRLVRRPAS